MKVPTIGVTTGVIQGQGRSRYTAYAQAVRKAGGRPVYLDPHAISAHELARILDGLDGLLLSGGKDIHPKYYSTGIDADMTFDEMQRMFGMSIELERDAFEIPLAKAACKREIPILGICRGFQVLNVALGGSLIQDIHSDIRHRAFMVGEKPGESASHPVEITSGSKTYRILGDSELLVNSRHHQGITKAEKARSLEAVAFAKDGIVEAVESVEHPWVLAVQWHPERTADAYVYEACKPLFKALVEVSSGL